MRLSNHKQLHRVKSGVQSVQMAQLTVASIEYAPIVESVSAMAQEGYVDLPYHNWQHALDTRDEAQRLVN